MSRKQRNGKIRIIVLLCMLSAGIILGSRTVFAQESRTEIVETQKASDSEVIKEKEPSGFLTAQVEGIAKTFALSGTARSAQYADWQEIGAEVAAPVGSGTSENPYKIGTAEELAWFMYQINSGNTQFKTSCVVLTDDIDLIGEIYGGTLEAPILWKPIAEYSGIFDGKGHVINGMSIDATLGGKFGLFALLNGARVQNLFLDKGVIAGSNNGYAGALAGIGSSLTVMDVHNRGVILDNAGRFSGGLIGEYGGAGVFTRCSNYASVSGSFESGGLIGSAHNTVQQTVRISDCYNAGELSSTVGSTGGILGRTDKGHNYGSLGRMVLIITNCYNTVPAYEQIALDNPRDGAIQKSNCFYDSGSQTVEGSKGVTGWPTADMKSQKLVDQLNSGQSNWYMDEIGMNSGYPVLWQNWKNWEAVGGTVSAPEGSGTESSPFLIGTPEDLAWFAYQVNNNHAVYGSACAKLTANISLEGESYGGTRWNPLSWVPIGKSSDVKFGGIIDGGDFTISILYMNRSELPSSPVYLGFIGAAGSAAVKNVNFQTVSLLARWEGTASASIYAGVVYGQADQSAVQHCSVLDGVLTLNPNGENMAGSGQVCIGGLVGGGTGTAIADCFSRMEITCLMDCSSVASGSGMGGLAGFIASGSANHAYFASVLTKPSAGSIPVDTIGNGITSNRVYYDKELCPLTGNGIGKTTEEMQSLQTLENLNDGRTGDSMIWFDDIIQMNGGYPGFTMFRSWLEVGKKVKGTIYMPEGMGTSVSPYRIGTAEALAWFMYTVNNDKNYIYASLTGDIDLMGASYGGTAGNPFPWVPMKDYEAVFEGNGYAIRYLNAGTADMEEAGLFEAVTGGGVQNLVLGTGSVTAGQYAGGITARLSGAYLKNVRNEGTKVNCQGTAGGLAGIAGAGVNLEQCMNIAAVGGTNLAGGLIGEAGGSGALTITDSCNLASLTGTSTAGICAAAQLNGLSITVQNSYNRSAASVPIASQAPSGGTVTMKNCYYDSGQTSVGETGGVTGRTSKEMKTPAIIELLNVGRSPQIWYLPGKKSDYDLTGGYPGFTKTEIGTFAEWSEYLLERTGKEYNPAGTYYLTEKNSLNFSAVTTPSPDPFTGNLYGNATVISNLKVPLFRQLSGFDQVIQDLTLYTAGSNGAESKAEDTSMGILASRADGSGRISNIKISGTMTVKSHCIDGAGGLLGNADASNAGLKIENCTVDLTISISGSGTGGISGGLIGIMKNGQVSNCSSRGSISGENGKTGGLVGEMISGTINTSFSSMDVDGLDGLEAAGGLAGSIGSGSEVVNCYASGMIYLVPVTNPAVRNAGLIGSCEGTVRDSYSSGRIETASGTSAGGVTGGGTGSVVNSYYDWQMAGKISESQPASTALKTKELVGTGLKTKGFSTTVWSFSEDSTQTHLSTYPRLSAFTDDGAYASTVAVELPGEDTVSDILPLSGIIRLSDTYGEGQGVVWTFDDPQITLDAETHTISYGSEKSDFPKGSYTLTASCKTGKRSFTVNVVRTIVRVQLEITDRDTEDGSVPEMSSQTFSGVSAEKYNGITVVQTEPDFITRMEPEDVTITPISDVSDHYFRYGSASANQNLGLSLLVGSTAEVDAASGKGSGSGIRGVRLYNGAAYNCAETRHVKICAGSVEIWVTIPSVRAKRIDAVIPAKPFIELSPGITDTAYSSDYELVNHSPFPLEMEITGVTESAGKDVKLSLVSDKTQIPGPDVSDLTKAGVTLSMVNPEQAQSVFEYSMVSGGIESPFQIKNDGKFQYRYKMEYNPLYLGSGEADFGYEIAYRIQVSPTDYTEE